MNAKSGKKKFNSNRLGFHIVLAIGITVVMLVLIVFLLKVFTMHGKEFPMPNYIGQNAGELTQLTCPQRFVFVIHDYMFLKEAVPGSVIKQNPTPGEKVKKGRKVYLTVAAAEPQKIKMPDLRDVSLRQAQIMLESQGLILDEVIEKPSPYENAVLEQLYRGHSIYPGTPIKMGEKISLVIGKDIETLRDSILTNEENEIPVSEIPH